MELLALPLNPSGKIDRAALPSTDGWRAEQTDGLTAPSGPVQEALAEIWAELLGLDEIGVDEDFFELGGSSLLATRAVTRIRETLGVEVRIATMFDEPTIEGLARSIEAQLGADDYETFVF
jgi:acyl carrier protein